MSNSSEDLKKYYEILEVEADVTESELKKAYNHLKALYSSHTVATLPIEDVWDDGDKGEIVEQIEEAYAALLPLVPKDDTPTEDNQESAALEFDQDEEPSLSIVLSDEDAGDLGLDEEPEEETEDEIEEEVEEETESIEDETEEEPEEEPEPTAEPIEEEIEESESLGESTEEEVEEDVEEEVESIEEEIEDSESMIESTEEEVEEDVEEETEEESVPPVEPIEDEVEEIKGGEIKGGEIRVVDHGTDEHPVVYIDFDDEEEEEGETLEGSLLTELLETEPTPPQDEEEEPETIPQPEPDAVETEETGQNEMEPETELVHEELEVDILEEHHEQAPAWGETSGLSLIDDSTVEPEPFETEEETEELVEEEPVTELDVEEESTEEPVVEETTEPEETSATEEPPFPIEPDKKEESAPTGLEETLAEVGTVSGAILKKIRQNRGLELEDISSDNDIPVELLEHIEQENFADLPDAGYLRYYITSYAKALSIEPKDAADQYMKRYREWSKSS